MIMEIQEVGHVNIVVSNIERSISFYRDILGLELIFEKEVCSDSFSRGVGLKNVKAKIVMLKLKGENTLIELIQYYQPVGEKITTMQPNTLPYFHVAFKVKDLHEMYQKLKEQGVIFLSEPQKLGDDVIFCYFRDPDGVILEFIEFPNS